ncbi:MAG: DUF362 domain-containing protein [Bacteroidota bacterium]
MLVSIIQDRKLSYPDASESFSPSERFPEYPFQHIALQENPVYHAVRDCLSQAGLDAANYGTNRWNPLGTYIGRGQKVFVLCNFVYHRKPGESVHDFLGKCTHGSVIRAVLDYVFIAAGPGGSISFGNAPLQSCEWNRVLDDTRASSVLEFYKREGVGITAKDLRLLIAPRSPLGDVRSSSEADENSATTVVLREDSLLDELSHSDETVKFRVTDYNPDRTEGFHRHREHRYVLNNEVLASDVIVSVPKLKTHEKVGITVGIKGLVGCVGHKDSLAHHRFGPPELQGDEYPDDGRWQVALSRFHDFVYRRRYPRGVAGILEVLDKSGRRVARKVFRKIRAGAWHGNDTAWRMAADLLRIVHFADRQGVMKTTTQRKHVVLIDGVVGGEGEGPLSPSGVDSRVVAFSDNLVCGDLAACALMGFDAKKIPMVQHAVTRSRLVDPSAPVDCRKDGKNINLEGVASALGRPFLPPTGWRGYLP